MASVDTPAVLIVDDNADKLVALESVLEELDVRIVKVQSGPEALRRLLTTDFAVILLDVRMPGMDGLETARLIRQRPRTAQTPIIFITAFGDDTTHLAGGYSLKAVDYLMAPVLPEVLRTKVAVFVELFRATTQMKEQAGRLQQRAAQLHQLSAASLSINSAMSLNAMLTLAADNAREILAARRTVASAHLEQQRNDRAVSLAPEVVNSEEKEGGALAIACATNRPYRATRYMEGHATTVLAAPLIARDGRNLGAVEVCGPPEHDFSQEDEDLLMQLANTTAVAIENLLFHEAREANRMKDEFLATVSHELRTPLSAMLSWAWMLRRGNLEPAASKRAIEAIERNARAQARLVDDLLDVSRILTGKLQLASRPVDLAQVVSAATDSAMAAAQAKGLTLVRHVDREAGSVLGDPDRLQQVVSNLLSNAIKFTPSGGQVSVHVQRVGRDATVCVEDTGAGIAPEFLPHVFERFRQADSSSTRSARGLGLGLAIVRHLVELHGGRVEARSAGPGLGSTFTVMLPLTAVDERAPGAEAVAEDTGPPEATSSLEGLRVLVVEDEADARDSLLLIVSQAGGEVRAVASAAEALETIARWRPQLLVCDIGLPGEDGYSLIRKVRSLGPEEGGTIPAVALTAYARPRDRARALAAGFQSHVAKPFQPGRLLTLLARLASRRLEASRLGRALDSPGGARDSGADRPMR